MSKLFSIHSKFNVLALIFMLFSIATNAQSTKQSTTKLLEDAEFFTAEAEYEKAYQVYKQLILKDSSNYLYKFQQGLSALNIPTRKEETILIFDDIINQNQVKKRELNDYLGYKYLNVPVYYRARAYHSNYQFSKAMEFFNEFLSSNVQDPKLKTEAEHFLNFSKSGIDLIAKPVKIELLNIGKPINTEAHEYVPLITADESMMLFTYRGPKSIGGLMNMEGKPNKNGIYFEDIYFSKKNANNSWDEPQSLGEDFNSKAHDACIAISADGQELYTFRSDVKDGGDIFVSYLKGDKWTLPERLNSTINTSFWEGSCSVSADGKYIYFASERPGGLGGKDIYVAEKQKTGMWGAAKNLRSINTAYDDDAPFIHADGITLFFSSQGNNSMGGYDIFYSTLENNEWTAPLNMGFPLNTTDDDRYYVINAKGDKGYLSSNRDHKDSDGSLDIYQVKPGWYEGKKHPLVMISGVVFGNDTIMESSISVIRKRDGELLGPFISNSSTGKFLINIPPHENYVFKINASGFPEYSEDMNASDFNSFLEIKKDFHLAAADYKDVHLDTLKKLNDLIPKNNPVVTTENTKEENKNTSETNNTNTGNQMVSNCGELKTLDFSALKGKSLNDPAVYEKLLQIGNKICANSMVFKVQVGAYKFPQNFKSNHLKSYGSIDKALGADGLTRFTQGACTNVYEAEQLRKKIISAGQKDAWIVGYIDGKRYTLEELIMVDFYNKNMVQYQENIELLMQLTQLAVK